MGVRTVRRTSLGGIVAVTVVVATLLPGATISGSASPGSDPTIDLRPQIMWKPIPFPDLRKDQTAAYSRRHSGSWTWRLTDPVVIVEHLTGGSTFEGAWNAFASNERDMGEKPGPCAHFVIDTDGTIYELVDLGVRCRHVVGLNDSSIGIEHVGTSARSVLRDRAMMRSSLRLTLWLMAVYGIEVRDVIGHAESLASPYRHERYRDWRCLTDTDLAHADMRIYRDRLRDMARANDVPVGRSPDWVNSDC